MVPVLIFSAQRNSPVPSGYNSRCLAPDFSGDEKYIAYFDQSFDDVLESSWTNSLKIFDISKQTGRQLLTRKFNQTSILWCAEIIDEFQQVKWSPDGQYLAFSLDGGYVEIYSLKENKTLSRVSFKKKPRDIFLGYFYLNWKRNDTLIAGYISKYAGLPDTHDTYGLIKKQGSSFVITDPVISPNSPLVSNLYPSGNKNNSPGSDGIPIIILGQDKGIKDILFNKEEIEYSWERFYLARAKSNQRVVLAASNSGRYAIVVENTGLKDNRFKGKYRVKVSLRQIPKAFRKKIIPRQK
jgi:hypothetical protein